MYTGTAVNETDYTYESKYLTIPAGSLTASTTITTIPNNKIEANKNIVVDLASIDNGIKAGVQFLNLVITDDDEAPVVTSGQEFSVGVDASDGTFIGTLEATDTDEPTTLGDWTITEGNEDGYFSLDAASGRTCACR